MAHTHTHYVHIERNIENTNLYHVELALFSGVSQQNLANVQAINVDALIMIVRFWIPCDRCTIFIECYTCTIHKMPIHIDECVRFFVVVIFGLELTCAMQWHFSKIYDQFLGFFFYQNKIAFFIIIHNLLTVEKFVLFNCVGCHFYRMRLFFSRDVKKMCVWTKWKCGDYIRIVYNTVVRVICDAGRFDSAYSMSSSLWQYRRHVLFH